MTTQATAFDTRELAHRTNNGIEVTLLWSRSGDRLFVTVRDARSGDWFELPADASNALQVFEHPYAEAAFLGIDYRAGESAGSEPCHV